MRAPLPAGWFSAASWAASAVAHAGAALALGLAALPTAAPPRVGLPAGGANGIRITPTLEAVDQPAQTPQAAGGEPLIATAPASRRIAAPARPSPSLPPILLEQAASPELALSLPVPAPMGLAPDWVALAGEPALWGPAAAEPASADDGDESRRAPLSAVAAAEASTASAAGAPREMSPAVGGRSGVDAAPAPHPGNPAPTYPAEARRLRQEGVVVLHLAIDIGGRVREVRVGSTSGFALLDQAAAEAARVWRFVPASVNGLAVDAQADVPVVFRLSGPHPL